jgi:hypothetical protein
VVPGDTAFVEEQAPWQTYPKLLQVLAHCKIWMGEKISSD